MSNDENSTVQGRLMSIDALRGLDMFLLVGIGGILRSMPKLSENGVFNFLAEQTKHTQWQGFHLWDLIFPLFIFIVGVSMPFAFGNRIKKGFSKKDLLWHVFKRSIVLFIIGLVLNGLRNPDFSNYTYTGVLQRIAVAYFFAAFIFISTNYKKQAMVASSLFILYWLAMKLIPVPGYGPGVITPEGNLHTFIDQLLLPGKFNNVFYDEDGILQQLSSIAVCITGGLAGHWLISSISEAKKVMGLLLFGVASVLIALLWNLSFPIVFKLWSSSFAMLTIGINLILLGLFYWLIDVKGYKKWSVFFVVVGLNPITIYLAVHIIDFGAIANVFVGGFNFGNGQALVFALITASIKWLFLYYLYKQRVFFKI